MFLSRYFLFRRWIRTKLHFFLLVMVIVTRSSKIRIPDGINLLKPGIPIFCPEIADISDQNRSTDLTMIHFFLFVMFIVPRSSEIRISDGINAQ